MIDRNDPIGISMHTGGLVRLDPNKPQVSYIKYSGETYMLKSCPTCQTELPSDHSAFDMEALSSYVNQNGGWSIFDSGRYGGVINNFTLPNGKMAQVVDRKTSYDTGDVDVDGYYGESALPQGADFETYVVIKVGDSYFRKTGTGDSYGEVTWDGDLRRVVAKEKVVLVFE